MHKGRRVRAFLRRHHRALTTASAAVVLLSFMLKEVLSDHLRDELATAQSFDTEIAKMHQEGRERGQWRILRNDLDKILKILEARGDNKKVDKIGSEAEARLSFLWNMDISIQHAISETRLLAQALQEEKRYKQKIDDLDGREHQLNERLAALDPQFGRPKNKPYTQADLNGLKQIQDETDKTFRDSEELLAGDVRMSFAIMKYNLRGQLSLTNLCVYVLFVFGWTLGLVLSFIGDKTQSSAD